MGSLTFAPSSPAFINKFGAAPSLETIENNLRLEGKVLPKYFYRFARLHVHPQSVSGSIKSRAGGFTAVANPPRSRVISREGDKTRICVTRLQTLEETTPACDAVSVGAKLAIPSEKRHQGMKRQKTNRQTNENLAFEIGRLTTQVAETGRKTVSHLNRMEEVLEKLSKDQERKKANTDEVSSKIAELTLQKNFVKMENQEVSSKIAELTLKLKTRFVAMENQVDNYYQTRLENYHAAVREMMKSLCTRIETTSQILQNHVTGQPDSISDAWKGTENLMGRNAEIENLLTRQFKLTEVPLPRFEAKQLAEAHMARLNGAREITKISME